MDVKFVGNIGTKALHIIEYADGRCRIDKIRAERKVEFETLEEAMKYPEGESPIFHECGVCFHKMRNIGKAN